MQHAALWYILRLEHILIVTFLIRSEILIFFNFCLWNTDFIVEVENYHEHYTYNHLMTTIKINFLLRKYEELSFIDNVFTMHFLHKTYSAKIWIYLHLKKWANAPMSWISNTRKSMFYIFMSGIFIIKIFRAVSWHPSFKFYENKNYKQYLKKQKQNSII